MANLPRPSPVSREATATAASRASQPGTSNVGREVEEEVVGLGKTPMSTTMRVEEGEGEGAGIEGKGEAGEEGATAANAGEAAGAIAGGDVGRTGLGLQRGASKLPII